MASEKFTADQMIAALKKARGMKTIAARALGCDYKTVVRYIEKYATVKQAFEEAQEEMADQVELTLFNQAMGVRGEDGEYKQYPSWQLLMFLARTHPALRKRGYAERQEITGADGDGLTIKVIRDNT